MNREGIVLEVYDKNVGERSQHCWDCVRSLRECQTSTNSSLFNDKAQRWRHKNDHWLFEQSENKASLKCKQISHSFPSPLCAFSEPQKSPTLKFLFGEPPQGGAVDYVVILSTHSISENNKDIKDLDQSPQKINRYFLIFRPVTRRLVFSSRTGTHLGRESTTLYGKKAKIKVPEMSFVKEILHNIPTNFDDL